MHENLAACQNLNQCTPVITFNVFTVAVIGYYCFTVSSTEVLQQHVLQP